MNPPDDFSPFYCSNYFDFVWNDMQSIAKNKMATVLFQAGYINNTSGRKRPILPEVLLSCLLSADEKDKLMTWAEDVGIKCYIVFSNSDCIVFPKRSDFVIFKLRWL